MSLRTTRQSAAIVAKKRGSLWAERYFDTRTPTFTSTSFAFARKQSLVTALPYYKLSTALL